MTAIIAILVMQSVLDVMTLASVDIPALLPGIFFWSGELLIWISTIFAIISGVIYLKQNWKFIEEI